VHLHSLKGDLKGFGPLRRRQLVIDVSHLRPALDDGAGSEELH
jgi:hypothetical protein